jgi:hypothetical protein
VALYSHKACIVHDERKRKTFKESVGEREMKGETGRVKERLGVEGVIERGKGRGRNHVWVPLHYVGNH